MAQSRFAIVVTVVTIVLITVLWLTSGSAQEADVAPPAVEIQPQAGVGGQCTMPTKMRWKNNNAGITTASTSAQKVIDDTILVSAAGCVIVHFQATATATTGESMFLLASVVGSGASPVDGPNVLSQPVATGFRFVSIDFIFPSVAPGTYSVQVLYRTANGTSISLYNRTMISYYR